MVAACAGPATTSPTGALGADLRAQVEDIEQRLRTSLDPAESVTINNAHGLLVSRCMQAAGFDVRTAMGTVEEQAAMTAGLSTFDVWTFDDVDGAKRLGYTAPLGRETSPAVEPADPGHMVDVDRLSPEEQERYWLTFAGTDEERIEIMEADGEPTSIAGGGCLGEATTAIFGDIELQLRFEDARSTAALQVIERVAANRSVAAATRAWRRCMGDAGYDVADPPSAVDQAWELTDRDARRVMAEADAACKRSSGLSIAYAAALVDVGTEVVAEFDDQLLAYEELERQALARARSVLGVGAP